MGHSSAINFSLMWISYLFADDGGDVVISHLPNLVEQPAMSGRRRLIAITYQNFDFETIYR